MENDQENSPIFLPDSFHPLEVFGSLGGFGSGETLGSVEGFGVPPGVFGTFGGWSSAGGGEPGLRKNGFQGSCGVPEFEFESGGVRIASLPELPSSEIDSEDIDFWGMGMVETLTERAPMTRKVRTALQTMMIESAVRENGSQRHQA